MVTELTTMSVKAKRLLVEKMNRVYAQCGLLQKALLADFSDVGTSHWRRLINDWSNGLNWPRKTYRLKLQSRHSIHSL
jgi:hypothetical protein